MCVLIMHAGGPFGDHDTDHPFKRRDIQKNEIVTFSDIAKVVPNSTLVTTMGSPFTHKIPYKFTLIGERSGIFYPNHNKELVGIFKDICTDKHLKDCCFRVKHYM